MCRLKPAFGASPGPAGGGRSIGVMKRERAASRTISAQAAAVLSSRAL